tara:strand:+ start:659 stop:1942 length:1284 start_codon:yes stop_codon:yes gene_type:complete
MSNSNKQSLSIKLNISVTKSKSNDTNNYEFSELSQKLTKKFSKDAKKNDGIFFTPPETVTKIITKIKSHKIDIIRILEPSCGSCEFINKLIKTFPDADITGIEYNNIIFDSIKDKFKSYKNVELIKKDYISYEETNKYDLIIGNPPFYVMKKGDTPNDYHDYFNGRPNIFILFILKSLKLLTDEGVLSFVLPKNFLNCLYYDKTRKFINKQFKILHIENCSDEYIDTKQDTIMLIVQKQTNPENKSFILEVSDYTIFGNVSDIISLKKYYTEFTTLDKLGFTVNVGNIVWNQCKSILTNDKSNTRLIYSSDIKDISEVTTYKNSAKKNYINKSGESGPLLVINRGYGVGQYKFEYCLIDVNYEYLIENHLICIRPQSDITKQKLITQYNRVIKSLSNKKTQDFIKLYFSNNAINTTELNYILPIFNN